ncbi:hypothetical protein GmHk_04G011236 [Glycine max]|nr:hypothetical protein GmHk_04G011236 [Glycine max]
MVANPKILRSLRHNSDTLHQKYSGAVKNHSALCSATVLQSLLFSGSMEVRRWKYALRSLQHAKNNIRSYSQVRKLYSASSVAVSNRILKKRKEI